MSEVNPFEELLGIDGQIQSFEELVDRYRKLEWIVYQLRERTGGDTDIIETVTNSETFETSFGSGEYQSKFSDYDQIESDMPVIQGIQDALDNYDQLDTDCYSKHEFTAKVASANLTAVNGDFIEVISKSTVTLDPQAAHNDQIIVGNGGGRVTISAGDVQIKYAGSSGDKLVINDEGTFIHFYKFVDGANEWWRGA